MADGGMLWVVGLMIVGIVGFVLMLATLLGALVSTVARAGRAVFGGAPRPPLGPRILDFRCRLCGRNNRAHARFCAQCGQALSAPREKTDLHG